MGRWVSEDPLGFAAGDGNLARYVGNSPNSKVDPSGLMEGMGGWENRVNRRLHSPNGNAVLDGQTDNGNNTPGAEEIFVGQGPPKMGLVPPDLSQLGQMAAWTMMHVSGIAGDWQSANYFEGLLNDWELYEEEIMEIAGPSSPTLPDGTPVLIGIVPPIGGLRPGAAPASVVRQGILTGETGSWGFTPRAETLIFAKPKGTNIPKVKERIEIGQEAHRQLEKEGLAEWEPEVTIELPDGTVVRKDGKSRENPLDVRIIKPATRPGRKSAEKRAELMKKHGFRPKVEFYDPTDPRFLPGSPTYIGPGKK